MITLTIKKQDGSVYWKEHFNKLDDCDKWLAEEKTRPYWDETYTHEILDKTPPPPTAEELAAIAAEENAHKEAKQFLKGLKKSDLVDLDKCSTAIMRIVKYLRADK